MTTAVGHAMLHCPICGGLLEADLQLDRVDLDEHIANSVSVRFLQPVVIRHPCQGRT